MDKIGHQGYFLAIKSGGKNMVKRKNELYSTALGFFIISAAI